MRLPGACCSDKYMRFGLEGGKSIILDRAQAQREGARILEQHAITFDRSADLRSVLPSMTRHRMLCCCMCMAGCATRKGRCARHCCAAACQGAVPCMLVTCSAARQGCRCHLSAAQLVGVLACRELTQTVKVAAEAEGPPHNACSAVLQVHVTV